jgi:hypothetical protein
MFLTVQYCVRDFTELILKILLKNHTLQEVFLSFLQFLMQEFLSILVGECEYVVTVYFGCFTDELWLAEASENDGSAQSECQLGHMVGTEPNKQEVGSFRDKLRVSEHR